MNEEVKVSVIVPVHDERENLPVLIDKMNRLCFSDAIKDLELIIVDDGSSDGTGEILKKYSEKSNFLKVFKHKNKMGITAAIKTGLTYAKGNTIIFIPADLESDPEQDIPQLISALSENKYDMVVGWRIGRRGNKVKASIIYNALTNSLFNMNLHDHNWIKAFKKHVKKVLVFKGSWHRFFAVMVHVGGFKVGEIKVNYYPRRSGKSKFNALRIIEGALDLLTLFFFIKISNRFSMGKNLGLREIVNTLKIFFKVTGKLSTNFREEEKASLK